MLPPLLPSVGAYPVLSDTVAGVGQEQPAPTLPSSLPRPAAGKNAGRGGLGRLLEHERYQFRFNLQTPTHLRAALAEFAAEYERTRGKTRTAIVSGAGIVGLSAAIRLRKKHGYNVIVVEKRTEATRKTVLDLKRSTLKEWPSDLIDALVANKCITRNTCRTEDIAGRLRMRPTSEPRSILADLAQPQARYYPQLFLQQSLPPPIMAGTSPWPYPLPDYDNHHDFYDSYALGQIRDLQAGMHLYCLASGIHLVHGNIRDLGKGDGEFIPAIQMQAAGEDLVRPPTGLSTVVIIAEGKTSRLENGFGGIEEISLDEVWHQRNFKVAQQTTAAAPDGCSAIRFDAEQGSLVITQIWEGPDGKQANVSVLCTPEKAAASGTASAGQQLDALFGQAQPMLERFAIPLTIEQQKETFRSSPIPVAITRAVNPVHDNVIFVGDSSGTGSPFNSRGANDGVIGQLRIMEEYLCDPGYQSADPDVRKGAQERARKKFNAVHRIRQGTALELLFQCGFYTQRQIEVILASLAREK